jgi:hypothetical protein
MKMMRTAMILLTLCPLTAINARPSGAETYRPWCVVYSGKSGARSCAFTSFEQCMMTATPGTGGSCVQNPWYARYGEHGRGQDGGDRRRSERQ